jgi:hypothetical protein
VNNSRVERGLTTADDASAGQWNRISNRLEDIGNPKISNLEDAPSTINQNILWLKVAMLMERRNFQSATCRNRDT